MADSFTRNEDDIARKMFERAMEDVYRSANVAKEAIEDLSILLDEMDRLTDDEKDKAEELITKALISLCGI